MSNSILILGESGTGKSTSIRNLPPSETLIINVLGKPLPFKGASKKYTLLSSDGKEGNYYASDDVTKILRLIKLVNDERPEIKYLVIDDFGYTITNQFMRKASQKGYDKFSEIGSNAFAIFKSLQELRDDLFGFVMMHTEIDAHGKYKPKTIGRMIDQYVVIEGQFTYVFHALTTDAGYKFLTNNDGTHMSKTPLGLYDEALIDNDLLEITNKIKQYNEEE